MAVLTADETSQESALPQHPTGRDTPPCAAQREDAPVQTDRPSRMSPTQALCPLPLPSLSVAQEAAAGCFPNCFAVVSNWVPQREPVLETQQTVPW